MKIFNKTILVLAVILATLSCSDEDLGLNQENPNSSTTDNYWNSLDRVESTMAAAYNGLLSHFIVSYHTEAVRADIAYPINRNASTGNFFTYYFQTFDRGSTDLNEKWESYYLVIFRANQVIEALEGLENGDGIDMEKWHDQMAEARFLRGLMHFYLHSLFNNGEIIIRDFVPVEVADFNIGTSTSDEVITFFREDLQYAYDNLPPSRPEGSYRATAAAAATALGTSHMYEGEYGAAIPIFEDVINNGAYGLSLQDASTLFTEAGENGSENIFEINFTVDVQTEDSQWDETSFNNRWGRFVSPTGAGAQRFAPSAWLTHAYANEPLNMQDPRNTVNGNPRPVSLRSSAMIAVIQDTVTEYYQTTWMADVNKTFQGNNFSYFKKLTSHDITDDEENLGGTSWKGGRNITLMRLADVYLMYAEALLQENGDVTGALAEINTIRDRWALQLLGADLGTGDDYDGVTYNVTTLMNHLMYVERPLELALEGHSIRNIDLRRWGVKGSWLSTLADAEYSLTSFSYAGKTQNNSLVVDSLGTGFSLDFEYEIAAANYKPEVHDYLPLPVEEERNNNGL